MDNASALRGRRMLIDGMNLGLREGTGVATYARELNAALRALGADTELLYDRGARARDPVLREVQFYDPGGGAGRLARLARRVSPARLAALNPGRSVRARQVPASGVVLREAFDVPQPPADAIHTAYRLFDQARRHFSLWGRCLTVDVDPVPDLVHWTFPLPLRVRGAKNIYTVHDLVPLRLPHTTLDDKAYHLRLVRHLARSADRLVTVSETSRTDILQVAGCAPGKVVNTFQASRLPRPLPGDDRDMLDIWLRARVGLPDRGYLLFAGAIEPKKNLLRVLEAYLGSGVRLPLLIVGRNGWSCERELALLDWIERRQQESPPLPGRVVRLGHLPYRSLVRLVSGARALVFPSLYEGFGLPVLEAMNLGTAVVTSDRGSLDEIAAGAALQVDPFDTDALSEALRRVEHDEALVMRLAAAGRERAEQFSEVAYRERLAALYAEVLVA